MSWIDSRGATIQKLAEANSLWVVDKLPPKEGKRFTLWEAVAEAGDDLDRLMRKWLEGTGMQLPRSIAARTPYFIDEALLNNPDSVLIVDNAHLLKPSVLRSMKILTEKAFAPVILVGDVAQIRVATDQFPDFYQNAMYMVKVNNLFQ